MNNRHRIGLLIPSSDIAMEYDLWTRLPTGLSLHVARMLMEATTIEGETKMLDEELRPAAQRLKSIIPELVIFGCTSAAALLGLEGDAAIAGQVQDIVGSRCITVLQASFEEISQKAPDRLLLFTPYIPEVTERMQNTFRQAEIPIIGYECLGLDNDIAIGSIRPKDIKNAVIKAVRNSSQNPDSVFISCTTFRALEIAEEVEALLGIPVFTSNRSVVSVINKFAHNTLGNSDMNRDKENSSQGVDRGPI